MALGTTNSNIAVKEERILLGGKPVAGNSYSGNASDSGIDILYVKGKSVQDGTPTPEAPVEIKSFGDGTIVHSGTCQLFDASKLATKTAGGATVTNNADGSFTVSGSGTMTEDFKSVMTYSHEETVAMLKPGDIMFKAEKTTYPYMFVQIKNNNGALFELGNSSSASVTKEITQDILDDETTYMQIGFYGTPTGSQGGAINAGTIKPMLYQDGDGEWCEYNHVDTVMNQPLRSLPNGVCDTYEDGKIVRRVGVVTIKGDSAETWEDFVLQTSGIGRSAVKVRGLKKNSLTLMSNKLPFIPWVNEPWTTTTYAISKFSGSDSVYVYVENAATLDEVKAFFQNNPVDVLYELETPVIENVSLPTIPSWHDWTNVWYDGVETDIVWLVLNSTRGALPIGGGTLAGNVNIKKRFPTVWFEFPDAGNQGFVQLVEHAISIGARMKAGIQDNQRSLLISDPDIYDLFGALKVRERFNGGDQQDYFVFGEHNKPTGSYTGNGSTTSRNVDIGGLGDMLSITSDIGMALVSNRGAICMDRQTGVVSGLKSWEINYKEGELTIATNSDFVNGSRTYWYQAL